MKILLFEDDEIAMLVLSKMIAKLGHIAICCKDGELALQLIDNTFNPIITDWMLPKVTGPELIERLQEKPGKHAPVLLLSGMPDTILAEKGKDIGADGYLSKPYTLDTLDAKIKELTSTGGSLNSGALCDTVNHWSCQTREGLDWEVRNQH